MLNAPVNFNFGGNDKDTEIMTKTIKLQTVVAWWTVIFRNTSTTTTVSFNISQDRTTTSLLRFLPLNPRTKVDHTIVLRKSRANDHSPESHESRPCFIVIIKLVGWSTFYCVTPNQHHRWKCCCWYTANVWTTSANTEHLRFTSLFKNTLEFK